MGDSRIYKGTASSLVKWVSHEETYGPHVMRLFFQKIASASRILDLGAGKGRDLLLAREAFPDASLHAVECASDNISALQGLNIDAQLLNIETQPLPFDAESLDIVMANQVLEHTKELFWICHEVSRVLKVGGHFIVGVPNVASFHNRIGLLFGKHPTQAKSFSAHVRCFSKNDFLSFFEETFPRGYSLSMFLGSQFYPFPAEISRFLSGVFPNLAFCLFFLLRKDKEYSDSIIKYPVDARLETNFKTE